MPKKRRGERTDGLIQVEVSLGYGADGKRKKKSFYGKTRKEANEKADAFRATLASGIDLARQHVTVKEWTEEWMRTYKAGLANQTRNGYQSALNVQVLPKIGHMRLSEVRHMDLQDCLNACAGKSSTLIGNVRTVITQSFRQAVRNRLLESNPAVDLELPESVDGTHRALEEWEIEIVRENWSAYHAGQWAMLMLYGGLRRGEMAAVLWEEIDLDAGMLHIQNGIEFVGNQPKRSKTKTSAGVRDVPIPEPLMEVLRSIWRPGITGNVCLSARGRPLTESAIDRNWETWQNVMELAANGEPPILQKGRRKAKPENRIIFSVRTHDMRHTFATMLYDAGVDEKTAQYLLGHADARITRELYTHLSERTKKASIDAWLEYNASTDTITDNTDIYGRQYHDKSGSKNTGGAVK